MFPVKTSELYTKENLYVRIVIVASYYRIQASRQCKKYYDKKKYNPI